MGETDFLTESEMTDKKDILLCSCYSTEHQMVILYSDDVINGNGVKHPMCYFHIHLNKRPFFERLKYGLMYIFGRNVIMVLLMNSSLTKRMRINYNQLLTT